MNRVQEGKMIELINRKVEEKRYEKLINDLNIVT
jgi:hypothetical protein